MEIVSPVRLAVGIAFLVAAVVLFVLGRKEKGLGQLRQLGGLSLLGCIAFTAGGFGYSLWG